MKLFKIIKILKINNADICSGIILFSGIFIAICYSSELENRKLNQLGDLFVNAKKFEIHYEWKDLSNEMKQTIKNLTGIELMASFGHPYNWTDTIFDKYEVYSQIIFFGENEKIEFIHFVVPPARGRLILRSKNTELKPTSCLYRMSNYVRTYSNLQYIFKLKWDEYNNFSEGTILIKCEQNQNVEKRVN